MSDAESVKIATRLKGGLPEGSPGGRCVARHDTGRVQPRWTPGAPEPLRFAAMDRSLLGRPARHLHAPLQHRPDGSDARRVPRGPADLRRRARRVRSSSAYSAPPSSPRSSSSRRTSGSAPTGSAITGSCSTARSSGRSRSSSPRSPRTLACPVRWPPCSVRSSAASRCWADPAARGRVDRRERALDPRLHRDRDGRRRRRSAARRPPGSKARPCWASAPGFALAPPAVRRDRADGASSSTRSSTACRS